MGFLLTVSFLIHGLSLFCIILLYMQVTKVKRIERLHQQNINKMEAAMSSYLAEFQEQNEQFLSQLRERSTSLSSEVEKSSVKSPLVDEEDMLVQRVDLKSEPSQSLHELLSIEENQKHIRTPFDELTTDQIQDLSGEEIKEFSVYLKRKGLTIEEIAKHLHRGKTEIELLLKFHQ
ncbi:MULTISPECIES: hypothetical protein [Priestia]|uniref:Coupling factor for flagellin transcription and translation n=1 Tax=Priestia megaterium (strain WSH-002) TaxID=1006007 RepID=A0A8D3WZ51_PRIMW|nr:MULTISPECIES: hypothetical protein [Priestia]AEN87945.1 hypothetical protein BMWSH_1061 [Priestia megaterium WSH-002]MED5246368.1 hypothetical protein [Priestia sp. LL-8]QDZ78918.1 hypothetical protein D0440_05560 [Priestia megaterium]SUV11766.1 coupling factor for flagellin transcription and translation [Priestia megaterium]